MSGDDDDGSVIIIIKRKAAKALAAGITPDSPIKRWHVLVLVTHLAAFVAGVLVF